MSSFPPFSRTSSGSSNGSKDTHHSLEIPATMMEYDHAKTASTPFQGSGDTASVSSKESSSSSDSDEAKTVVSKYDLQGDIHYDDGPSRKSSFQANTSNSAMMMLGHIQGGYMSKSSSEIIDKALTTLAAYNKHAGTVVTPKALQMTEGDGSVVAGPPSHQPKTTVAARIQLYSGSGHRHNGGGAPKPKTAGNHHDQKSSTPATFEAATANNNRNGSATTAGQPSHVPLAPVRRIPSILGSRITPSRIGSLSSIKETVASEDEEASPTIQGRGIMEEEITLEDAMEAERAATDEESYWEDSVSEIGSVHTENPQFIAIGIVRPPSITASSEEMSTAPPSQDKNQQEAISEAVAQDIAKEEHDLKHQESVMASERSARRRSAPSILASRKVAMEHEEHSNGDSAASRPTRASFSMGSRARGNGSSAVGPSKAFLLSLPEDELLPTVVEPAAPPVRTTSDSKPSEQSSNEANQEISSKASSTINPRVRARKSNSGSGESLMSEEDRAAKMRTVRGALGVEAGTKRRAYRSYSDAGTMQPVIPSRNMSTAQQSDATETADASNSGTTATKDEVSVCPSLRTIQTMQSSRSLASNSSGITLDEKTTERIARSAPLRARRPTRTISDDTTLNGSSAAASSASIHSDGDQKMAAANSIPSTSSASAARPSDDKRSMRVSTSSMQSSSSSAAAPISGSVRPSDEKAQYRRPDVSSMHSRGSTGSGIASFASATSEAISRSSHSNSYPEIHEEVPFQTVMASDTMSNNEETEDLEAQAGVPVLLPGAFAVGGSQDEDDAFDDTDSLVGSAIETIDVIDDNPSQTLSRGSISGSVEASTPLQAELYEESFVNAEILIEEEEAEEKILKRSFLARTICIFFVVAAIAGIVIGVVLPKTTNKDTVIETGENQAGVPVIEGWNEVGETLMGPTYKDNIRFGNTVALSAGGTRMAVGLPGADDTSPRNLKSTGAVKIYDTVNGTEWIEVSQIIGLFANAESGSKVALSHDGRRVAIGAPATASDQSGYVAVYQETNETGQWEQVGDSIRGDVSIEEVFGDSIGFSSDGTVLAIGDKYSDRISDSAEDTGLLRVFHEFNNTWIQKGLDLFGAEPGERFAWTVALSGDGNRVVATSLGTNDSPGTVQAFDFDGILWNQVGSTLVGESPREAFGASIALSDDGMRLASGATSFSRGGQEAGVGIVRAYEFDVAQQEWSPLGKPLEGLNAFDAYGSSVDLSSSGDVLAIGGPENQNFCDNCGHIQVFRLEDDGWNRIGSELGKEDIDGGQYGYALALSSEGDRVAGAAPFTTFDGFVSKVGQVFVFNLDDDEDEDEAN